MILKNNAKIIRNLGGEIVNDEASESGLILSVNPQVRQFHNRIDINEADSKVSRLMDSAQNICFSQSDSAKQFVLNYDGYFEGATTKVLSANKVAPEINSGAVKIEFWAKIQTLSTSQRIIECDEATNRGWSILTSGNNIAIYDGIATVQNIIPLTVADENLWQLYTMYLDYNEPAINGLVNGVVRYGGFFTPIPLLNPNNNPLYFMGSGNPAASSFLGGLSWITFDTGVDIFSQKLGVQGVNNALWYKKYQNKSGNKKLFLSSRNTDGAVINSASEITSIKSEVFNTFIYSDGSSKATLSKNGFYTGASYTDIRGYLIDDTTFAQSRLYFTNKDFLISACVNFPSTAANANYFLMGKITSPKFEIYVGYSKTNNQIFVLMSSNGTSWDVDTRSTVNVQLPQDTFANLAIMRFGDTLYFFINGILKDTFNLPTNYTLFEGNTSIKLFSTGGTSWAGYVDDILLSIGTSEIDPTLFAGNPKKFQPDLRKSLEVRKSTALIQYIEDN